ncbi:glycosyltransferase family 2 protein [Citricoccus nitrophenolicus]|uniref:Glycosyl transferase family 2 n=1 Tax=Citricoccus muralis TaxID=169134 RepID=A0A3D9L7W7_9MICC|nr:glycosyltransferase family A protein [Citricoccus muralis]REE02405.1 glycosyl transferase family 2 [Citricoccus muralis]
MSTATAVIYHRTLTLPTHRNAAAPSGTGRPLAPAETTVIGTAMDRTGTAVGNGADASVPLATVTVVIPCFNYGRFLHGAVTSVLSQDEVEVDVVIVDDCSTDDSVLVAEALAAADDRVRVVRHAKNRGAVQTFNDGLAEARGEFLVRLDADDLLTPGSLARAVRLARRFPSVGLVYGHPVHFMDGQRLPPARDRATSWTVWPGASWVQERCADGRNVITSAEVLMRRSVVERVGGQRDLAHTHDMEMWLRLASFSDVGYVHGADQAWHRDHPASLSAREVDVAVDLAERRLAFSTLFSGAAGSLPWAVEACRTVRDRLDRETLELLSHEVDANGGNSPMFARLLELELTPTRRNLTSRDRILRRAARSRGPADRAMSLSRRATARLRREREFRNWHQNGVYSR